jgi:hypothetical protein
MTSGAAAGAAGTVGAANAINQGVSSYLNYNQGNNLLAALRGRNTGFQTPQGYGTVVPGDYSSVTG